MTKFAPTAQQQAITTNLATGTGHLAIVARAGCGKTSTILLGVDAILRTDPAAEILVCAYNKAIADEVSAKLEAAGHDWRQVRASTLHSAGFGLLKFLFKPTIDDRKVDKLVDAINDPMAAEFRAQVIALVHVAKQAGVGFFPDSPIEAAHIWHELADHFDINGLDDTSQAEQIVALAQMVYRQSLAQTDVIDFDDMVLFPLVKNLRVKFTKTHIFLDEAQDLSRARQALARKFLRPHTGRMIVVGDDRQAIYGFSGADSAALPNLIESLQATVLPLSVTWRCPRAVVALAQTLVPDIEAAPTAAEGEVLSIPSHRTVQLAISRKLTDEELADLGPEHTLLGADTLRKTTQHQAIIHWYGDPEGPVGKLCPTDAILCRNTAPLIKLAYQLIRTKIPCKVEGRAIGDGLKGLAQRWKLSTIAALLKRLETYKERERQKAVAKGNEAKAAEVEDRVATLEEICRACTEAGKTGIADVVAFIDDLFADGAENVVVLATYHRSKGREWPRVFLLEHSTRCPSKAARQAWQKQQEANLAYVAFTRAQQSLVFVG